MKLKAVIIATLFVTATSLVKASDLSYKLPITRDNHTQTRVAHAMWQGEYPSPVIDVSSHKKGYTPILAYKSLRILDQPLNCSIHNGLYHPWSKSKNSIINYYTLTAVNEVQARKAARLGDKAINAGQRITEIHHLGEGLCEGNTKIANQLTAIEFHCNDVENQDFSQLTPQSDYIEQWLYLRCREGYKAFVRDIELLKQSGIKKGGHASTYHFGS